MLLYTDVMLVQVSAARLSQDQSNALMSSVDTRFDVIDNRPARVRLSQHYLESTDRSIVSAMVYGMRELPSRPL